MSAYRAFSIFTGLLVIAAIVCSSNQAANAQRGGMRRGFGDDGGLRLLSSKQVQDELELVEEQVEKINGLQSSQRDEMRKMFTGMRDRFRDMDRESKQDAISEMRAEMASLNEKFADQAKEILLPHQVTRWEQLHFQSQAMRAGSADRFLGNKDVAKKLNITDEQMVALKEKAAEIRKTMQEKIGKIRAEARDEILSVLTPEQQEQYKSLTGESFTFDDSQRGGWGGRGGGRGRDRGRRGDRGDGNGPRDRPRDGGSPAKTAGD